MTESNRTSEPTESTDETLPATAEIDTPAEATYSCTFANGTYANIIIDLKNTDDLNPEIRVYPEPGPDSAAKRVIVPLKNYNPSESAEPVVSVPDEESPSSVTVQLPVDGELLDIVTAEVGNRTPYLTVTVPDTLAYSETPGPAFQGYAVHTDPRR